MNRFKTKSAWTKSFNFGLSFAGFRIFTRFELSAFKKLEKRKVLFEVIANVVFFHVFDKLAGKRISEVSMGASLIVKDDVTNMNIGNAAFSGVTIDGKEIAVNGADDKQFISYSGEPIRDMFFIADGQRATVDLSFVTFGKTYTTSFFENYLPYAALYGPNVMWYVKTGPAAEDRISKTASAPTGLPYI